jgi:hypothetical protein
VRAGAQRTLGRADEFATSGGAASLVRPAHMDRTWCSCA